MNNPRNWIFLLFSVACFGLMLPACSSDDDPTDPGGTGPDTTAPRVTDVDPADGMLEVAIAGQVVFTFDEPMDPASSTGQISLSDGTVDGLTWLDDMNLSVDYSGWPMATEVTVTAGTGLADEAGNKLAGPFRVSMWTMSDVLAVMEFMPADGAVNVNRTAPIELLFSDRMNAPSLETGVTIKDGTKAVLPFTLDDINGYSFSLAPDEPLPANTEITVTMSTAVQTSEGENLAAPVVFSFTTNDVIDTTPPTIVSFDPASGSIMPGNQAAVTIVFSEAMDTQNFSPSMMNGQFGWLISQTLGSIQWSEGDTKLTVPMPADLPAGLSLQVKFAGYSDANGNVQPAETSWASTVAGTADSYPVSDGYRWTTMGTWTEGPPGTDIPTDGGEEWIYYEFKERMEANQWDKLTYYDPGYTVVDYYEIQNVTGQGVFVVGFAEDEGSNKAVLTEYFLSSPLALAEFPLVVGNSWTSNATATLPDGTLAATMSGEVIGREDLPFNPVGGDFDVVWTDVWRIQLALTVSLDSQTTSNELTTLWIAPGLGVVKEFYREDVVYPVEDRGWSESEGWLYINLD